MMFIILRVDDKKYMIQTYTVVSYITIMYNYQVRVHLNQLRE